MDRDPLYVNLQEAYRELSAPPGLKLRLERLACMARNREGPASPGGEKTRVSAPRMILAFAVGGLMLSLLAVALLHRVGKPVPAEAPTGLPIAQEKPLEDGGSGIEGAQTKRGPEPAAGAQKRAEKLIRGLFKEDYSKRAPADQKALARKLLRQGIDTPDDPAARYVLLREAREIAARCGDMNTALAAIDESARHYEIDGLELKASVLSTATTLVRSPADASTFAEACLVVVDEAIRVDKFDLAKSLVRKAEKALESAKDSAKLDGAQRKMMEIEEMQGEAEKAKTASEVLALNPDDPEASLGLGRYLLMKRDPAKALPLLTKGADPLLRSAAAKELAAASDPGKAMEAADAWWAAKEKEKIGILRDALLGLARHDYEKAVEGTTGFTRTRAEKRIEEIHSMTSQYRDGLSWIDLVPLIEPRRDAVKGTWEIRNGKLYSDNTSCARIEIPVEAPEEYDFHVKFARLEGNDDVVQTLSHLGKQFNWGVGYYKNKYFSFDRVANGRAGANPTSVSRGIMNNRAYTSLVEVRRNCVSAYIDGELIARYLTDYKDLDLFDAWKLRSRNCIGLATQLSPTEFSEVRLRVVSGSFKLLK